MKYSKFFATFAILALPSCNGVEGDEALHHYAASEWDVESPQSNPCATSRGIFGRSAKFEQRVIHTYELTFKKGEYLTEALESPPAEGGAINPGIKGVFRAIETKIADNLLKTNIFESVCAGGTVRGPYQRGNERQLLRNNERALRAVGISSNPEDQILEGRK